MRKHKKLFYSLPLLMLLINLVYAKAEGTVTLESIFSNDYVFAILLIVAIATAVFEVLTPGFGIFGILSIACFFTFFWGSIRMGNTNFFEISLFVIGLLLLGFEIMIPGFGVAGVSGIIAVSAGLVLSMSDIYFALFSLTLALVIALILGYGLVKRGIKSEAINRLRLFKESSSDKGYVSVKAGEVSPGDVLITKTPLRPTGYAILGDRKIEVVSNTGFIGKDESVVVVKISGARVYVENK
ncbi:NfeD family protein [Peptoniphilus vaginalis]|uniref:NfeD family protein n=1 Tax=Peptoniphilus vaginalis TaxID=1756987 RepID=UPI0023F9AB8D|nr:NfeD family protein [Peptoniphilus vaginalis]